MVRASNLQLGPPVALLIFAAAELFSQPSTRPAFDAFEVATIHPTAPDWTGGRFVRMLSADRLAARNYALKALIAFAYDLHPKAISGGPAWIESDRYDILAKTPGNVRPNLVEQMAMLRKLLDERFKLTFHRESRELPIYALTVGRSGAKLSESKTSPDATPEGPLPLIFVIFPQLVKLPAHNASMAELASVLQRTALDRPVVDQTGLSGRYDFDLEWTPDERQFGGALGRSAADDSTKPGIFSAIQQQLGLRLEATRGPVSLLVIDRIARPSEN